MEENTTVYISWGGNEYRTHELFARVTDQNLQVLRALLKNQVLMFYHMFLKMVIIQKDHGKNCMSG